MIMENGIHHHLKFLQIHRKTYTKHGKWALPVYPTNLSIVGSPQTPYIYDDRCSFEDVAIEYLNFILCLKKKDKKEEKQD